MGWGGAVLNRPPCRDTLRGRLFTPGFLLLLLALLAACVQPAPLPDVGDCADYPDGVYEFGEIGIGTCIAGPYDLAFTTDDAGAPVLLVSNADPYKLFTGGSLLAIPYGDVDLSLDRNVVSDLNPAALDLPDFAGGIALQGSTALVTSRYSKDARTRQHWDELYAIDLADPLNPVLSARGEEGGATLTVQSDPIDAVLDPVSNLAFVANRTSHSISVVDASAELLAIKPPWPERVLTTAVFSDGDLSGSRAELVDLDVIDDGLLTDDLWTLRWVAGTWRVWLSDEEGLTRYETTGDGQYQMAPGGVELSVEDVGTEMNHPAWLDGGRMFFDDGTGIRSARVDTYIGDWRVESVYALTGRSGEWDAVISAAAPLVNIDGYWLLYEGRAEAGGAPSIGISYSVDGATFRRVVAEGSESTEIRPVLEGEVDGYDADGVGDPTVLFDNDTGLYHLYYTAYAGDARTIGHATSTDLLTWSRDAEPVFAGVGQRVAAPVVTAESGDWRMWYVVDDGVSWQIAAAWSPDGAHWQDLGPVLDTGVPSAEPPPSAAVQAAPLSAFNIEGESAGPLGIPIEPGDRFATVDKGWVGTLLVGATLSPGDAGAASEGGIRVDSVDAERGLAWLSLTSEGGLGRIGVGTIDAEGQITPVPGALFEGAGSFDIDGVSNPVVFRDDEGLYWMFYAGSRGSKARIGLASSADGLRWTAEGQVLSTGEDWDIASVVPGSVERLSNGEVRLWYSGFDGDVWRIGSAKGAPTELQRERVGAGWTFSPGDPGEWDDSGVRDPFVLAGTNALGKPGLHLWFSGYDGDAWRVGYAFREEGAGAADFVRAETDTGAVSRPVINLSGGLFHPDGAVRPVMIADDDGFSGYYAGLSRSVERAGRVWGAAPDRLHKRFANPTLGDTLSFATERGDADAVAIPLDTLVDNNAMVGVGLTSLHLDSTRGFLYAASKLVPYVFVLDVRDDSSQGFADLNYLDIEAVLAFDNASAADGIRKVIAPAGSDFLYGIGDEPEAVWVIDLSEVEDDSFGELHYDTAVGWLPAPRAGESDEGAYSGSSVGPAGIALHPDGRRLFVTNYNANSVTVYDLTLGPVGMLVAEVPLVGENPAELLFTPDGKQAIIANYAGEVDEDDLVMSNLAVLDVDEASPTYLEVLTWIANR